MSAFSFEDPDRTITDYMSDVKIEVPDGTEADDTQGVKTEIPDGTEVDSVRGVKLEVPDGTEADNKQGVTPEASDSSGTDTIPTGSFGVPDRTQFSNPAAPPPDAKVPMYIPTECTNRIAERTIFTLPFFRAVTLYREISNQLPSADKSLWLDLGMKTLKRYWKRRYELALNELAVKITCAGCSKLGFDYALGTEHESYNDLQVVLKKTDLARINCDTTTKICREFRKTQEAFWRRHLGSCFEWSAGIGPGGYAEGVGSEAVTELAASREAWEEGLRQIREGSEIPVEEEHQAGAERILSIDEIFGAIDAKWDPLVSLQTQRASQTDYESPPLRETPVEEGVEVDWEEFGNWALEQAANRAGHEMALPVEYAAVGTVSDSQQYWTLQSREAITEVGHERPHSKESAVGAVSDSEQSWGWLKANSASEAERERPLAGEYAAGGRSVDQGRLATLPVEEAVNEAEFEKPPSQQAETAPSQSDSSETTGNNSADAGSEADGGTPSHVAVNRRTFLCDRCDRRFTRRDGLERHYRSAHTEDKLFECQDCDRKFSRSDSLIRHARTHSTPTLTGWRSANRGVNEAFEWPPLRGGAIVEGENVDQEQLSSFLTEEGVASPAKGRKC